MPVHQTLGESIGEVGQIGKQSECPLVGSEKGPTHTAGYAVVPGRVGQADKGGTGFSHGLTPLLREKA
jgi:hypothetical protein